MTSLVSEIEELAFKDIESFKGVLSTTEYESKVNLQLHTAYIEIRSAYEELLGPYMSTARLCLEMLFELETGTSVSPKTVGPFPSTHYPSKQSLYDDALSSATIIFSRAGGYVALRGDPCDELSFITSLPLCRTAGH